MDWFASMLKAQADFTEQFAKMVGGMPPLGPAAPELVNPPAGSGDGDQCTVRHS